MSLIVLLLTTVTLSAQTVDVAPANPVAKLVQSLVAAAPSDVRTVYAPLGYNLLWTRGAKPTPQALAVIAQLEGAASKGLEPADYEAGAWASRIATLNGDAALARFDVALTTNLVRYSSDLRLGRVNPREVRFDLDTQSKKLYVPAFVAQVSSATNVNAVIAGIEPKHEEYQRLITALAKYRRIEAESRNDVALPSVAKLAPGQPYEALAQLATILRRNGDLAADAQVNTATYEGALVDAVKHFQSRHGLDADGILGRTTFTQLNTSASQRVAQIELALERWRWVPEQTAGASILVNIPEFQLRARDESGKEMTMRVVVGKASNHRTPVFEGDVKHVVFRPYWNVPPSIERGEILPKVTRDYGYLTRNNYELVDDSGRVVAVNADSVRRFRNGSLRVRQKPGTSNALGLVKFLFPNDNNVYLHSTPQQALFARTRRDFSHGCIRVEDPVALAAWVLGDRTDWSKEKIESTINGKRDDVYVKIARPVTVTIHYATAVARENGDVHFLEDIYGHDLQLAKILAPQTKGGAVMVAAK